jgi:anhydro-N-acetylmuramic acid kinase
MGLYLGMISGTSMDAIDAALVDFDVEPLRVVAASATEFDPALKRRVSALIDHADSVALDELGEIDVELGRAFARAALALMRNAGVSAGQVTAIGSHGQTLRHRPDLAAPFTWQIGDPNVLVIANLGGIANITILARDSTVTGFDTGPANRLLDAWISLHEGKEFDAGGEWAASGQVDGTLLGELLDEPYLRAAPPKSTGRELFNLPWLQNKLGLFSRRPRDVQATLQQFTARSVADAVRRFAPGAALYVCGGGAHNVSLLNAISLLIAPNRVASTAALGLDPDYVEAVAFAWFAKRTLAGLTSSAGSVTGAKGARILGGIYRYA